MLNTIVKAKPSETHLPWNQRQAYIAMGFLLETAALLKIDSVPLEGIDPVKYDEILGLKNSEYKSVAAVALGYRHSEDQYQNVKKSRFDEKFIFEER
jgi:nitroreductase